MSFDTSQMRRSSSSSTSSLPPKRPAGPNHSILSTLSYPVSYTVSGLLRRISADEPPTPLGRALSANYNGSVTEVSKGTLPKRRLSPFQPPPLTPLSLSGFKDSTPHRSRLLHRALAEEIRLLVPPRLQLVDTWKLVYSLEQDGTSLASLYGLCDAYTGKRGGFVLAVRDASGGVFGAYLTDVPRPSASYYGTGECFLWRTFHPTSAPPSLLSSPTSITSPSTTHSHLPPTLSAAEADLLASLPPPPSEDTTHLGRSTTLLERTPTPSLPGQGLGQGVSATTNPISSGTDALLSPLSPTSSGPVRFKAFPYTGENDFTILCGAGFISVGGGEGRYGLWLDAALAKGVSETCPTFANEPLSSAAGSVAEGGGGRRFDVLGVEVWYLGS